MAPKKTSLMSPTKASLLSLLLTFFISSTSCNLLPPTETKFTVYFHDFFTGPNATFVRVAGIPGNRWSFDDFGTVFVTDEFITETPSVNAPIIARAQGLYVVSSVDASNAYNTFSLSFIRKTYAGSTLEIQGRFVQSSTVNEFSISSGTGKFRFATGYVIFTTIVFNTTNLLIRADITVRVAQAKP